MFFSGNQGPLLSHKMDGLLLTYCLMSLLQVVMFGALLEGRDAHFWCSPKLHRMEIGYFLENMFCSPIAAFSGNVIFQKTLQFPYACSEIHPLQKADLQYCCSALVFVNLEKKYSKRSSILVLKFQA